MSAALKPIMAPGQALAVCMVHPFDKEIAGRAVFDAIIAMTKLPVKSVFIIRALFAEPQAQLLC
jgi:hypothetical protein